MTSTAGGDIEDTIVAAVVLLPTTLGPSLLPWPGRSLALLPASALVPAFVALNGVYSQTHWPGGYLLPGLPLHASAEEWRLRLLLLAIALATTALRLAWRRWARRRGAEA